MQVMGIGSNLDIQGLIDKLMAVERQPLIRLESQKKDYSSMQSIWRDLNTRLSALSTSLDNLNLNSDFTKVKSESSDDKVITATAEANAAFGSYEIEIKQLAKTHKVSSDKYDNKIEENVTITINGKEVLVEASPESPKTLVDVARVINNTEDIGVVASVIDNHLVIETKDTNQEIDFSGDNQFLKDIGLLDNASNVVHELQRPQEAKVVINGIEVVRDSNTIEDAIIGVKLNLKKESEDIVNITVARDVDAIFNKIKGFVDEYQKVQNYLDSQTFFTKGADGKNNTTGKLFGDSTINILKTRLRSILTDTVEGIEDGNLIMLSQIGIELDKTGKIKLDEDKLKAAISEKPNQVAELFIKEETGITAKMQGYIKSYTQYSGIIDNKVKYYDARIKDVEQSVERWEQRLEMKRSSLVRQFTALDKAMSSSYNQSAWLSSQLAQLTTPNLF